MSAFAGIIASVPLPIDDSASEPRRGWEPATSAMCSGPMSPALTASGWTLASSDIHACESSARRSSGIFTEPILTAASRTLSTAGSAALAVAARTRRRSR